MFLLACTVLDLTSPGNYCPDVSQPWSLYPPWPLSIKTYILNCIKFFPLWTNHHPLPPLLFSFSSILPFLQLFSPFVHPQFYYSVKYFHSYLLLSKGKLVLRTYQIWSQWEYLYRPDCWTGPKVGNLSGVIVGTHTPPAEGMMQCWAVSF